MPAHPDNPADPYLHERLRKALAEDSRVGESNVRVTHAGGRIWLQGCVATPERRLAAQLVAKEIVGEAVEIRNDLEVMEVSGPSVERIE